MVLSLYPDSDPLSGTISQVSLVPRSPCGTPRPSAAPGPASARRPGVRENERGRSAGGGRRLSLVSTRTLAHAARRGCDVNETLIPLHSNPLTLTAHVTHTSHVSDMTEHGLPGTRTGGGAAPRCGRRARSPRRASSVLCVVSWRVPCHYPAISQYGPFAWPQAA